MARSSMDLKRGLKKVSPDRISLITVASLWLIREAWFIFVTQKLINKLMSRNYYDFKFSDNLRTDRSKNDLNKDQLFNDPEFEDIGRIGIV